MNTLQKRLLVKKPNLEKIFKIGKKQDANLRKCTDNTIEMYHNKVIWMDSKIRTFYTWDQTQTYPKCAVISPFLYSNPQEIRFDTKTNVS